MPMRVGMLRRMLKIQEQIRASGSAQLRTPPYANSNALLCYAMHLVAKTLVFLLKTLSQSRIQQPARHCPTHYKSLTALVKVSSSSEEIG